MSDIDIEITNAIEDQLASGGPMTVEAIREWVSELAAPFITEKLLSEYLARRRGSDE